MKVDRVARTLDQLLRQYNTQGALFYSRVPVCIYTENIDFCCLVPKRE